MQVVSGGVAANSVIRAGLSLVANLNDVPLIAPPTRLCTDNGVMIAWNGVLLQRVGSRIVHDPSQVDFEPSAPFGVDCRALVRQAGIKIRPIKIPDSMFSGNPL
ncbi:N6-L-threonylcarbamoyladenine synthase [Paragonimus westermani]|uniref:N6-L-threonylcarbamoyladenine synthase n=1 Tax=Paragonimus westermani TaxID=34504 RepID=A0A5J4NU67_9TREM|nr:N6-L-threonylcarbamoyladenine synthase [Paragonimus westermani]